MYADVKKIIASLNEGKAKTIAETVMGIKALKEAVKEQLVRDIDRQCQNLCLEKRGTLCFELKARFVRRGAK